jgi:hypothetical protein
MTARLCNRTDGRWHIEIMPDEGPDSIEGPFMLALSAKNVTMIARSVGSSIIVEVAEGDYNYETLLQVR